MTTTSYSLWAVPGTAADKATGKALVELDPETGRVVRTVTRRLAYFKGQARALAVDTSGGWAVAGIDLTALRLVELGTGRCRNVGLVGPHQQQPEPSAVAISPEGLVVSAYGYLRAGRTLPLLGAPLADLVARATPDGSPVGQVAAQWMSTGYPEPLSASAFVSVALRPGGVSALRVWSDGRRAIEHFDAAGVWESSAAAPAEARALRVVRGMLFAAAWPGVYGPEETLFEATPEGVLRGGVRIAGPALALAVEV